MVKRRKETSVLKKVLIIAGVLIAAQVVFIFMKGGEKHRQSAREAIEEALRKQRNLPPERLDKMRVQLAIKQYQVQNNKLPKALKDLIPDFLDRIPADPVTKQDIRYQISGKSYLLGESTTEAPSMLPNGENLTPEEQRALISSLSNPVQDANYIYDPSNKRDPFRPFNFNPHSNEDCATPLECIDPRQLKLTAVLGDAQGGTAIVENDAGKGFTIRVGTKVGRFAEVAEILADRVKIVESKIDFVGQQKSEVIEMRLRTKDQEKALRQ